MVVAVTDVEVESGNGVLVVKMVLVACGAGKGSGFWAGVLSFIEFLLICLAGAGLLFLVGKILEVF